MTYDEMIAVIQACKDGRTVQFRSHREIAKDDWLDVPEPTFQFNALDYRVKPEPPKPREWWIYPVEGRDACAIETCPAPAFVHVREVL